MKNGLKGLVMLSLAYFLFSRIASGTLFFYINNRFAWLTFLAVLGFFVVALGYLYRARLVRDMLAGGEDHDHEHHHDHGHEHDHDHGHTHEHNLSRVGLVLVMLPVILGLLVPARPLGAVAMGNREGGVGRLSSAATPRESRLASANREKDLLDWLLTFDRTPDQAVLDGQEARLTGFVYRDDTHGRDSFLLSRFVVSCCVADAIPISLIVQWPAAHELANDQWVEVSGHFLTGLWVGGRPAPVLVADEVESTTMPNRPYVFP